MPKSGGVQTNIIKTNKRAKGSMVFDTDDHPNKGGAAPANPPITIFWV